VALNTYRNTEQIAELLEKLNALTVEVHQHITIARNDLIASPTGQRSSQAPQ
jgi:hypothetical protein